MPITGKKVIFIVGPTATGKTALALKLARILDGEIISCDSMQVYKGADILSQAPTKDQTKNIPYHLVRFLSPLEEFSAARFVKEARRLIEDILRRKKVPIIAGGTGLYVKTLIDGLFPSPAADEKFRNKMYAYAERHGNAALHKKLAAVDRRAARLIHENDTRRIVRALEIWHTTGRTMTELKKSTKGIAGEYDIKIFGLSAKREFIYSNIDKRVDRMVRAGALKEAKKLYKKRLSKTARSMIGLKELSGFLNKEYDLDLAKELMKHNTRRFAKRQLTWFRADKRVRWFDVSSLQANKVSEAILKRF
jgi:tRNA dimethylallyltransferase